MNPKEWIGLHSPGSEEIWVRIKDISTIEKAHNYIISDDFMAAKITMSSGYIIISDVPYDAFMEDIRSRGI